MHMKTGWALASAMTMALAMAGCDGKPEAEGAGPAAASKAAAQPADDSVAAVLVSAGSAPAQLRFLIATPPRLGEPFTLVVSASAAQPVPELQLDLESAAMTVAPSSAVVAIDQAGGIATHEFEVTPSATGLAQISVQMNAGGPVARYSIPVLVPEVAAEAAKASDEADPPAKGDDRNP